MSVHDSAFSSYVGQCRFNANHYLFLLWLHVYHQSVFSSFFFYHIKETFGNCLAQLTGLAKSAALLDVLRAKF